MTYQDIIAYYGNRTDSTSAVQEQPEQSRLALRVNDENPNHHLWNNRGTWWCHFTIHRDNYTAERIRVSLKTRDVEEARDRRDQLLASVS